MDNQKVSLHYESICDNKQMDNQEFTIHYESICDFLGDLNGWTI